MAIQVAWGNYDRTVVLYTFDGAWTWQEFFAAIDIARRLARTVDHPVKEIIDMTNADDIPSYITLPLNAMNNMKLLIHSVHSSECEVLVVGIKPLVKALWETFRAVASPKLATNVCFVKTLEEAYRMAAPQTVSQLAS
jgi:hypothetical protein